MDILARLRLAKIQTMARPNSPDMQPKRTKKVRLGINIIAQRGTPENKRKVGKIVKHHKVQRPNLF